MIYLDFNEPVSLQEIYASGQCFRWEDLGNDAYRIIAGTHLADVCQTDATLISINDYSTGKMNERDVIPFWSWYFDQSTSYRDIRKLIPASDAYLTQAAEAGAGIRILNQDPWEMIITFIISQRKNIPAIRTCVEKLCAVAGKKIRLPQNDSQNSKADIPQFFRSFPTSDELLKLRCSKALGLSEDGSDLCSFQKAGYKSCSLGYRMPYILDAACWIESHPIAELKTYDDDELLNALMEIKGVGIKVASCAMLFGFHRLNAFPVDVWMKRVLTEQYPKGFSLEQYAPYAGIMQQYLFCRIRQEKIPIR